jgi:archaellum component FlaC
MHLTNFDVRISEIDKRFASVKRDVEGMEAQLSEAKLELARLQGEYRVIQQLKKEAEAEDDLLKNIPIPEKFPEAEKIKAAGKPKKA